MATATNHLVRLSYVPRIVVYLGAALVLAVDRGEGSGNLHLVLIPLTLAVPHLLYIICARFLNHSPGARYIMVVDAGIVGLLIVAMGFNLSGILSFLVCLIIATALISPPIMLLLNLLIVALVCGLFFTLGNFNISSDVQDLIGAIPLISFSAVVAWLCFRNTSQLVRIRREIGRQNLHLQKHNTRLQPYISDQVFRSAAHDVAIDSKRCHLTVFFSDIEGFTHLMDHLDEETITRMLNEYLDEMAQIAYRFGGTVDKFIGDGVMVFFGDQQSPGIGNDALDCIHMALEMREKLREIACRWREYGPELHIRIGINSGICTVGNFGSAQRMDYTAVGSVVNRASRLEGCASRNEILISDTTWRLISEAVVCCAKRPVLVKGIDQPIPVFSVERLTGTRQSL